jgi:hypothetical protein
MAVRAASGWKARPRNGGCGLPPHALKNTETDKLSKKKYEIRHMDGMRLRCVRSGLWSILIERGSGLDAFPLMMSLNRMQGIANKYQKRYGNSFLRLVWITAYFSNVSR